MPSFPIYQFARVKKSATETSSPVQVLSGRSFIYKAYTHLPANINSSGDISTADIVDEHIEASLTGSGSITTADFSTGWPLVNTYTIRAGCIYATSSRLFITDTSTSNIWYPDTPESGGLTSASATFNGSASKAQYIGSKFYAYESGLVGSWNYESSATPYTSWSNTLVGSGTDWYDSNRNIEFGGYIYGCPNHLLSNGMLRIDPLTGIEDGSFSPTGLPTTGTEAIYAKDSSALYLFVSTGKVYRSTNGTSWSLFYDFGSSVSPSAARFDGSSIIAVYQVGANLSGVMTIPDGGGTPVLSTNSITHGGVKSELVNVNGNTYYIVSQLISSTYYAKVYKKV